MDKVMKNKQLFSLMMMALLSGALPARAQKEDLSALNQFKYAVVQTLYDENLEVDKYGITSNVRRHFIEKGFTTVTETKRYWPEELYNDPCVGVYCFITAQSGVFSKYKVLIEMKDCNGRVMYSHLGKGVGESEQEAFLVATERALAAFDKWHYEYKPGATLTLKENEVDRKLTGIYEAFGEDAGLRIVVVSEKDQLEARIEQSGLKKYKSGTLLAIFRQSSLGENLYNVTWLPQEKNSYETFANFEVEDGRLIVELKEKGGRKQLVFRKLGL